LNTIKACKSEADLSKAVADPGTNSKSLDGKVEEVRTNATVVKACVKANFKSWAKELTAMQSANLREKAQDRLSRSQKEFEAIVTVAGKAKEKILPFVSEVKDIVIFLNADTSQEALKSLSGNIWKIGNASKSMNDSLGGVIKQIDKTVKSLPQK
jgi:hypothetical protein